MPNHFPNFDKHYSVAVMAIGSVLSYFNSRKINEVN